MRNLFLALALIALAPLTAQAQAGRFGGGAQQAHSAHAAAENARNQSATTSPRYTVRSRAYIKARRAGNKAYRGRSKARWEDERLNGMRLPGGHHQLKNGDITGPDGKVVYSDDKSRMPQTAPRQTTSQKSAPASGKQEMSAEQKRLLRNLKEATNQ